MKKVLLLTALRSGSTYIVDNLILSIEKKYSVTPAHEPYYNAKEIRINKSDDPVSNQFAVIKLSWLVHLHELEKVDELSNYDAILLKRKDKLGQCISMVTALQNPSFAFNFYKESEDEFNNWLSSDPKCYVSKESFFMYCWMREDIEKGSRNFKTKFKSFTEVDYEDFDDNVENLKTLLNKVDLPYHLPSDDKTVSMKRNWDKWKSVVNKKEVLAWAEELFPKLGYTIDPKYY